MQLHNQTIIPDNLINPILQLSGKHIRARTPDVLVLVTSLVRGGLTKGTAFNYYTISSKRLKNSTSSRILITDGGWIHLRIPPISSVSSSKMFVQRFWYVCLHEWGHIFDLQNGGPKRLPWSKDHRQRWIDRPEEQRAELYVAEVETKIHLGILKNPISILTELENWIDTYQVR